MENSEFQDLPILQIDNSENPPEFVSQVQRRLGFSGEQN